MRTLACLAFSLGAALTAHAQPRMVNVGDARIRYDVTGEGPAVVFIHGWAQDLSIWDKQARAFAPRYRVVRFDRRGFGESTGHADGSRDPADLLALLDSLGIRTAHVVGLSAGARTAINFAASYPDRTSALVYYGGGPVAEFPGMTGPNPQALFSEVARVHGVDSVRRFILGSPLFWDPPNRPDLVALKQRMVAAYAGRDLVDPRPESGRVPDARWSQLPGMRVPTLIVNGDHDFPDFLIVADSLVRRMPNARRVVIKNGGHGAHFAQPQDFNTALLEFFASVERLPQ
ncbi:MAG: alpha/beta fold hydrolase [Gemmatimonadaceae bacterium]